MFNDRFFASQPDFRVYEYDVPAEPPAGAWELCRGLGYSFCVNRNERVEDHLTAAQVVALLVETVAKGGNLLLNVGPNADGTVPEIQARVLRDSGVWIRAHAEAIHGSSPFDVPGDGRHWYTRAGGHVHAFDLASAAEPRFAGLAGAQRVMTPAGADLAFRTESGALVIDARAIDRDPLGTRYVVDVGGPARIAVNRARPGGAARNRRRYATITEALTGAQAGDVVDVGPGRYTAAIGERFPLVVPAGVTVRAAAAMGARRVVIDAEGAVAVQLAGDDSTLERVTVRGGAPGYMMIPPTCVVGNGGDRLVVRDCHVESIALAGGTGHQVIANVIAGGSISLMGTVGCEVRANYQHGLRWGVGIMIAGGADHVVVENECRDDLCAIRVAGTERARVDHNRTETRWWGIHVLDATDTVVRSNRASHVMRAVNVEGARAQRNVIERQLAEHCDTGLVIERGAGATRAGRLVVPRLPGRVVGLGSRYRRGHEHRDQRAPRPRRRRLRVDGRDMTTEYLLVAIWRVAGVAPDDFATGITDGWAPEALMAESVVSCTVNLAEADQGQYTREPDAHGLVPNCDALIALGLTRAHDIDDLPARDAIHAIARRVEVWRVEPRRVISYERDWPDGRSAPGVKMVSFMRRAEGLSHEQFVRHWTENHAPLAQRHHVGLWNYTQNVVRRALTPGGAAIDGVAELHFRTRDDFEHKFFDSDAGRAVILEDVKRFMMPPSLETALMRELTLRTPK